jgi:hypothetical protein
MSERMLDSEAILSPSLPEQCRPALETLAELEALATADEIEQSARAEALQDELLARASELCQPTPRELAAGSATLTGCFAEAVLLWTRLPETASAPVIDTLGSRTLATFPLDLPMDEHAAQTIQVALGDAFGLAAAELERMRGLIRHLTSNLDLKRAIARALADEMRHRVEPAERVRWMHDFYGPLPFRPGDVDLVLTATALFFCIPREDSKLCVSDWDERPEAERRRLRAFLGEVVRHNVAETDRFPAFGLFEPELLAPGLIDELCRATGARRDALIATLTTMVHVTQTRQVEMYLVHDSWGHTWQEALSEFEWEYAHLAELDEPLDPRDGPTFGGEDAPTLGSCFVVRGGRTALDEARLVDFARADHGGRIQIAQSVGLAEMLADFMEAKYSRARPEVPLPTTSLLPSHRLKLDLTVSDVRRQVVRAAHPYRALIEEPAARGRLAEKLAAERPEAGLLSAVERAAKVLGALFGPALDGELDARPSSGGLRASVLRRLLLQLALIAAELERALGAFAAQADPPWRDPASCPDLVALFATHFYEHDRRRHFWHLDEVLRTDLGVCCGRLAAALEGRIGA